LGKLDLVVEGMKMIWPETPWWKDDVARINDARPMRGYFYFLWVERGERRRGRERERARGVRESFSLLSSSRSL
jgi:hypothetical protein